MSELDTTLHDLASALSTRKFRETAAPEETAARDARVPRTNDAQQASFTCREGASETRLQELAHQIGEMLPWRSAETGEPVAMAVLGTGWLEADDVLHPRGTAFVTVGVDSWDAADAVRDSLDNFAGLDEAAWALDWMPSTSAFRMIRVFPEFDPR